MLTELDKKIIASIQGDIPITERPYLEIAEKLGISEEILLESLQKLCDNGVIRRFGATLRHQKTGYEANAMVRLNSVGQVLLLGKLRNSSLLFRSICSGCNIWDFRMSIRFC